MEWECALCAITQWAKNESFFFNEFDLFNLSWLETAGSRASASSFRREKKKSSCSFVGLAASWERIWNVSLIIYLFGSIDAGDAHRKRTYSTGCIPKSIAKCTNECNQKFTPFADSQFESQPHNADSQSSIRRAWHFGDSHTLRK